MRDDIIAESVKFYVAFGQGFINELSHTHVISIESIEAMYHNVFNFSLFNVVLEPLEVRASRVCSAVTIIRIKCEIG